MKKEEEELSAVGVDEEEVEAVEGVVPEKKFRYSRKGSNVIKKGPNAI